MVFVSAGHNSKSTTIKQDPGAMNKQGVKEGDLTIEFRDIVIYELGLLGVKCIKDSEEENLGMYLRRINTGNGSVVVEYHFDSNEKPEPTGCTGLVEAEADRFDIAFAKKLNDTTASILGIKNRGVLTEKQSHRGSLGLMREDGLICLVELCFISNPDDLAKYHAKKKELAKAHAKIIKEFEDLIP